jgi:hypothetical protein
VAAGGFGIIIVASLSWPRRPVRAQDSTFVLVRSAITGRSLFTACCSPGRFARSIHVRDGGSLQVLEIDEPKLSILANFPRLPGRVAVEVRETRA